jgi:hypothetical protein
MKKQVKKLQLKKHTVQVLKNVHEVNGGGPTFQNNTIGDSEGGECSFGTRCFVCYRPAPRKP